MTANTPEPPVDGPAELAERGAPSDNDLLTNVLDELAEEGYASSFRPASEGVGLICGNCGAETSAADLGVAKERRLEGASDPDDMMLVVAATCPACGTGGAVALGYGPNASPEDGDIVAALASRPGDGPVEDSVPAVGE